MYYAGQRGLDDVVKRMREFAARSPVDSVFWTPAPRIEWLAAEGGTLA
jgi:hypothetical protein